MIKLVYFKKDQEEYFNWDDGFAWLYKDNAITIKIPPDHMMDPTFLVGHELAHAKQIIEKRLKSQNTSELVSYRSKVNEKYKHYNSKRQEAFNTQIPPWEKEAVARHCEIVEGVRYE